MAATIPLSLADYNEWVKASKRPTFELHVRASAAKKRHESVVYLDQAQLARWRTGSLTPWRRPDVLYVYRDHPRRSWPVLPEQLTESSARGS